MTTLMRAVVVDAPGGPEVLQVRDVPVPDVAPGQVLIRVRAFGLNRSELHFRRGQASFGSFPRIPGIEAAGVVADAPGGEHPVGTQVVTMMGGMGRTIDGGYAEHVVVPAAGIEADVAAGTVHIEASWYFDQARGGQRHLVPDEPVSDLVARYLGQIEAVVAAARADFAPGLRSDVVADMRRRARFEGARASSSPPIRLTCAGARADSPGTDLARRRISGGQHGARERTRKLRSLERVDEPGVVFMPLTCDDGH